jgi:putative flippase GtrA
MKFVCLGAFTYFFAFGQTYVYTEILGLPKAVAYGITQACIFSLNLFVARLWIFRSTSETVFRQGARFLLAVLVFRFADWSIFVLITHLFPLPIGLAIFLSMGIVFPVKFITYDKKVFHDR